MSRIPYRIWDKENNKFYEPTYAAYKSELEELGLLPNGTLMMRTINQTIHESIFPDRFEVQLQTPKRDIKGKMIHEGDIIKLPYYDRRNRFEVIYHDCGFLFIRETGTRYRADQLDWNHVEVVDHIYSSGKKRTMKVEHENPERFKHHKKFPF